MTHWPCSFFGGLLAALSAGSLLAPAAEADRYLPNDTAVLLHVNVRQVLDSPLAQREAPRLQALFLSRDPDKVTLDLLGIDPFRDVANVLFAGPAGDREKVLTILHGRFDPARCRARGDEIARTRGDLLKPLPAGGFLFYEAKNFGLYARQKQHAFLALLDVNTLVVSPSREYVLEALDKAAGRRVTALNRQVQDLIGRANAGQSLWIVEIGNSSLVSALGNHRLTRDIVDKTETISGGLNVGADLQGLLVIGTRDKRTAHQLAREINVRVRELALVLFPSGKARNQALEEILQTVRAGPQDRVVYLGVRIPANAVDIGLQKYQ
ncbi:MAG: hypothetical protein JO112_22820 [Planctomycetes bacterium]|nr:hypothetical protein [Planctomycetota bacterium]